MNNAKPDIIVITETMGIDGPERVISELSKQWAKDGHHIIMVLTRANLREPTYSLPDSIKCIRVNAHAKGGKLARLREIIQIRAIIAEYPHAVCVSLMVSTSFSLAIASFGLKNKVVLSERNDPRKVPFTELQRRFRNLSFELADAVVFQTQEAMNHFSKRIQKKGQIIFNPINPEVPSRHDGKRRKVFVAVGRLAPQKNFTLLVNAFAKFINQFPDYRLIIYGEGPDRDALQKLIEENRMHDRVSLPGFSKDVYHEIVDCAAFISSSDYEGMSNSMLEALAMGIPTICTDCPIGGARQVIQNNCNGLLVPVGDADALQRAMKRIAEDRVFCDEISIKASKIRETLNIKAISDQWIDVFRG